MKRILTVFLIFAFAAFNGNVAFSQNDTAVSYSDTTTPTYHVAVISPLYLDSAFDRLGIFRYDKSIPPMMKQGIEFYEGIMLAVDSLKKESFPLDVHVYDSRSTTIPLQKVVRSDEFKNMNLIIGHVTAVDAKLLAGVAANMNIPFINANYPNDGGITNNPYYVILNSTLWTHVDALYKFLQRNFALSTITVFNKKGFQEDRLKSYLTQIEKSTASVPLKLKFVTLNDDFTAAELSKYLDESLTNVCIGASLDINFAGKLSAALAEVRDQYAVTIFGMPTWDVIDFAKPEYKGLEVYFGTPFYISEANNLTNYVLQEYYSKYFVRATDIVFRAYETLYHFSHLLGIHGSNLSSSLSDKRFKLFTDFEIKPVINPKTTVLDYFENKKIYFIRKVDGNVTAIY